MATFNGDGWHPLGRGRDQEPDRDRDDAPAFDTKHTSLLGHEVRVEIVEALSRMPGVNKNVLATQLDLRRSLLDFHLDRLIRGDIVVTKPGVKGGQRVCFLSRDEHLWENPSTRILFGGEPTRNVAIYIAENPGATVQEIASALDRSESTVRHHLEALRENDLVDRIRIDRTHEHHAERSLVEWTYEVAEGFERPWEEEEAGDGQDG